MRTPAPNDVNDPRPPPGVDRRVADDESGFDAAAIFADVEAEIARERARPLAGLRALSTPARSAALLAIASVLVLLVGGTTCRDDLDSFPTWRLLLEASVFASALALVLRLSLRPIARPTLPRPALGAALAASLLVAVGLALWPGPPVSGFGPIGGPDWSAGWPCLWLGLLAGAPVYLAARMLDRGARNTTWLAAAAAGVAGNLVLTLHCPHGNVEHKLSSHASVGFVFLACLASAVLLERLAGRARSAP